MVLSILKITPPINEAAGKLVHGFLIAKLKSAYESYGAFVYSLCLRLLDDKKYESGP